MKHLLQFHEALEAQGFWLQYFFCNHFENLQVLFRSPKYISYLVGAECSRMNLLDHKGQADLMVVFLG